MGSRVRVGIAASVAVALGIAVQVAAQDPSSDGESLEYQVLASNSYKQSLEFVPLDRFPDMALDGRLQAPGIEKPERLIVKDAAAWSAFWKRANPALAEQATKLPIDFAHDVVVVSAAGLKPTHANVGIITDVLEFPREIRVEVEETAGTCAGPREPSHPLAAVRIARPAKPIAFDVRAIPCPAAE